MGPSISLQSGWPRCTGQGQIHRDIKPSNVLVTTENRVVLLDFGLVRAEAGRSDESMVSFALGTPEYMSPEQASGSELTPACDWYAVGALLHEALTGVPPFVGHPIDVMMNKQTTEALPPSAASPDTPGDLDALCSALLRRDPAARPSEAEILGRFYVELRRDDATYLALPVSRSADVFVGRAAELDQLERALEASAAGAGKLLFVTGDWGIGKTALLRVFLARLRRHPLSPIVFSGRCHERETIPFKSVDMLMDDLGRYLVGQTLPLPDDADLVARTFPILGRVRAIDQLQLRSFAGWSAQERRGRLFAACRQLFRLVAASRPLVLIVDDLQWADPDGLALLHEVLVPPFDVPILFVGALRSSAPAALIEGLSDALLPAVALERMSPAHTGELVDALLPDASAAQRARIVEESGGHPLFTRELTLSDAQGVPLEAALHRRMRELPAEARRLLEVVALAVTAVPQAVVAQAAGVEWTAADRAFSLLRAALLVRSVGLRRDDLVEVPHERLREAVSANVLPPAAKAIHRALAAALEQSPRGTPLSIADHWLAGGEEGHAVERLVAGASHAMEVLAFEQAASIYRRILQLAPPGQHAAIAAQLREADRLAQGHHE